MQKKTLYTDEGLGRDEPISAADTGLSCQLHTLCSPLVRVFIVSLMYNNFLCSSFAESFSLKNGFPSYHRNGAPCP